MNAVEIYEKAKEKYPAHVTYTGKISEEDRIDIEKTCKIKSFSVYMDGSATYDIAYRKERLNI